MGSVRSAPFLRAADVPAEQLTLLGAALAAVGVLWKLHLDADKRDRDESAEWKAIAQSSSRNVGELVAGVTKLTAAVETEHRAAEDARDDERDFRAEVRAQLAALGRSR
jgi:hypothetical protein